MATERPPLALHAELLYPDGTSTRWDGDAPRASDVPSGITIATQRYTGFGAAQLTLNRRIDLAYQDMGLLYGLNLIGHDGSVAYEGRIASMPRSLQTSPSIVVQAQGWMSHAKDEPFVECYVDRYRGKWVAPSRARIVTVLSQNFAPGSVSQMVDEAGHPGIELAFQGAWASPFKPMAEAWWLPQPGITLGALYYSLPAVTHVNFADAEWHVKAWLCLSDTAFNDEVAIKAVPASGYLAATTSNTVAAALQLYYEKSPFAIAGEPFSAIFENLAVYGQHGLTRRGEDPGGFYVSDMIANIAQRFAPKLDTSGIQATTFPVPQAAFLAETLPYDAWQTLNTYHRWEMDVYEGRRLNYYPIDLTDYDWEVRLSDPGTTVTLQGDDTVNLCNGVVVRYRDLDTGYETRLSPDVYPELRDESPDNPANLNGLKLYTPMSLTVPTTKEGALQIGRAFLSEFNQAKAPGTITITGHIRDRAGHFQQVWKVRASDRLIISDLPSDAVRVVGETSYNHDSKQLTIAVDSSFKRLDAILSRLGVAVEASNLVLP